MPLVAPIHSDAVLAVFTTNDNLRCRDRCDDPVGGVRRHLIAKSLDLDGAALLAHKRLAVLRLNHRADELDGDRPMFDDDFLRRRWGGIVERLS